MEFGSLAKITFLGLLVAIYFSIEIKLESVIVKT